MRLPLVLLLSLLVASPAFASAPAPARSSTAPATTATRPVPPPAPAPIVVDRGGDAKTFFETFAKLLREFRPEIATLYSPGAQVCTFRQEQNKPEPTKICVEGAKWSDMLRQTMPLSRARGETIEFANIKTEPQPHDTVKVTATRINRTTAFSAPFQLYIQRGTDGKWLIVRELSVTRQETR